MECRVCQSKRISFLCAVPNQHTETSELDCFRCHECGSMYIGNEITSDELGEAYASIDTDTYYDEVDEPTKQKMNTVVKNVEDRISKSAHILDIGAGGGHLIEAFNQNEYENLYAHEVPSSGIEGVDSITKDIYQDFDYESIPSNKFDLVTLIDVLEHVPDPSYLIESCKRILKPGGIIYLHTPVVSELDRIMQRVQKVPVISAVGETWQRSRNSIFHLSLFTTTSLSLLLDQSGFIECDVQTKNELSWPIDRYIDTYITGRYDLPEATTSFLSPVMSMVLKSQILNANKGVAIAELNKKNSQASLVKE